MRRRAKRWLPYSYQFSVHSYFDIRRADQCYRASNGGRVLDALGSVPPRAGGDSSYYPRTKGLHQSRNGWYVLLIFPTGDYIIIPSSGVITSYVSTTPFLVEELQVLLDLVDNVESEIF